MHHAKTAILKSFGLVVTVFARFFLICLLVVMAAEGLAFVDHLNSYAILQRFFLVEQSFQKPVVDLLHANIPCVFGGLDFAPYMIAVALLILWGVCEAELYRLRHMEWRVSEERKVAQRIKAAAKEEKRRKEDLKALSAAQAERDARLRADMAAARRAAEDEAAIARAAADAAAARAEAAAARIAAEKETVRIAAEAEAARAAARRIAAEAEASRARMAAEAEAARAAAEAQAALAKAHNAETVRAPEPARAPAPPIELPHVSGEGSQREQLLELYAQTKKSLEEQKKNLSFLAIDVVDSTGMKLGEDSALAERDFRQYKKLVERVISAHKGLKAAWTPDGVMICFASVQNAVQAAQDLIRSLDHFNKTVKTIKADFRIRCGINAGKVLWDESVKMEEMTDRNIDIAGHMQKYAQANTIYVGAQAIEGVRAHGFKPAQKQVDGHDVYEWHDDGSAEPVKAAA
jgi:hypothetical protein